MYTLHYTSADGPGPDATWSVYAEDYTSILANEPIDGSTRLIESGLPDETAANRVAAARQRDSYRTNRMKEQSNG